MFVVPNNNMPLALTEEARLPTMKSRRRHALLLEHVEGLSSLAHRAACAWNMSPRRFVALCVQVDSCWKPFVDMLASGCGRNGHFDPKKEPVARIIVSASICRRLSEVFPEAADSLMKTPSAGKMKAIVLDDGGMNMYEIEPTPERGAS